MRDTALYPEFFEPPFAGVLRVRPRLGFLFVLTIPLCAGLAALKDVTVAGFGMPLYILGFIVLTSSVVVLVEKAMNHGHHAVIAPFWPWMVWFGFVWLSLLWKIDLATRDVQFALQMGLPLLVGMVAAMFVTNREQLDTLRKMYPVALAMIVVILFLQNRNLFGLEYTSTRQTAMTVALIACLFLAESPGRVMRPLVGWGLCAAVCALTESRMALLIVLALPVLHPAYRQPLRRLGACLLIGGVCVGLLYTPPRPAAAVPGGTRGGVRSARGRRAGHRALRSLAVDCRQGSGASDCGRRRQRVVQLRADRLGPDDRTAQRVPAHRLRIRSRRTEHLPPRHRVATRGPAALDPALARQYAARIHSIVSRNHGAPHGRVHGQPARVQHRAWMPDLRVDGSRAWCHPT